MKKLMFKVVVMMLVVLGASNYMMYIMTGKLPFDPKNMSMPDLSMSKSAKSVMPGGGKQTAYKWKDENGVMHYSSEPPPAHLTAKTIEVDPNTNMVQGLRKEEEKEEVAKKEPEPIIPGQIYNPKNIKKLVDDARNVETLLNDRHDAQQKMLEGI